jgi:hypothetical protein
MASMAMMMARRELVTSRRRRADRPETTRDSSWLNLGYSFCISAIPDGVRLSSTLRRSPAFSVRSIQPCASSVFTTPVSVAFEIAAASAA